MHRPPLQVLQPSAQLRSFRLGGGGKKTLLGLVDLLVVRLHRRGREAHRAAARKALQECGLALFRADAEIDARLRAERSSLLDRWREEHGQRGGRTSDGWDETMRAAWDGRVETLIVTGATETAFECPQCGRGSTSPGSCELDGTELEEALGGSLEVAVRGTLLHGGRVRTAAPEELGDTGPAVALLRYPVTV